VVAVHRQTATNGRGFETPEGESAARAWPAAAAAAAGVGREGTLRRACRPVLEGSTTSGANI